MSRIDDYIVIEKYDIEGYHFVIIIIIIIIIILFPVFHLYPRSILVL